MGATQQELLTRLQAGDEGALADLASAYGPKIQQLAFRYLRNKEDAEEVMQDVLYKVHRNVGAFRGDAALSSWIYRITFNAAMSRLRTVKYQRSQQSPDIEWRPNARATRRLQRRATSPTGRTWLTSTCCARSCASASFARFCRCPRSTGRR